MGRVWGGFRTGIRKSYKKMFCEGLGCFCSLGFLDHSGHGFHTLSFGLVSCVSCILWCNLYNCMVADTTTHCHVLIRSTACAFAEESSWGETPTSALLPASGKKIYTQPCIASACCQRVLLHIKYCSAASSMPFA